MTELEETILKRLDFLEREFARLKTGGANLGSEFEALPDSSVVGKDYVAFRFGITERAVLRGEAGTHRIRRVSKKPLKFVKSEVDAVWRQKTKAPKKKAADLRENASKRRYSIVGKTARA